MGRKWTPEQRAKQAALIQQWQPWKASTGAKTEQGKAVSSMNAYKGGQRAKERAKRKEWREVVRALDAAFTRRGYLRRGFQR
jgi:hypothetical protein